MINKQSLRFYLENVYKNYFSYDILHNKNSFNNFFFLT